MLQFNEAILLGHGHTIAEIRVVRAPHKELLTESRSNVFSENRYKTLRHVCKYLASGSLKLAIFIRESFVNYVFIALAFGCYLLY